MIKLDKRLSAIQNEIRGKLIADIGCDHGKLSVSSLIDGKCERVIAGDVSAGSLSKTVSLAKEYDLANKIDCRLTDGFDSISEDLDTAIIAGLGGYEIKSILTKKIPNITRLVLCPHQNAGVLRKALNTLGYGAIKDYVVKEGKKYYQIIVAEKNDIRFLDSELRFGKNIPPSSEYREMLLARKEILDERFVGRDIPDGEMKEEYQEIEKCLKSEM